MKLMSGYGLLTVFSATAMFLGARSCASEIPHKLNILLQGGEEVTPNITESPYLSIIFGDGGIADVDCVLARFKSGEITLRQLKDGRFALTGEAEDVIMVNSFNGQRPSVDTSLHKQPTTAVVDSEVVAKFTDEVSARGLGYYTFEVDGFPTYTFNITDGNFVDFTRFMTQEESGSIVQANELKFVTFPQ